jgi:hypothetical protein
MVSDHLESARNTLSEYVSNLLTGSGALDDNVVAVYLPNVKATF